VEGEDDGAVNPVARIQAFVAAVILLLCSCTNGDKERELLPPVTNSNSEASRKTSVTELQRLYRAAGSEQERRAVALRAIDEGAVYCGGPIANLDRIFGTHSELPATGQIKSGIPILFATQPSAGSDRVAEAIPFVGSYLIVKYDHDGKVQYYYLSNLHKGLSGRIVGREPISVAELKRLYDSAKTEAERRDVALKAIDDSVIRIFEPVHVSTIDEIFGTHLASQLPTNKEKTRTGIVSFAAPAQTNGWFMAIDYSYDGHIENYYLTNISEVGCRGSK
jgi:hypothetical protein